MAMWDDVPSEHERRIFGLSRFSRRVGFGKKPALLAGGDVIIFKEEASAFFGTPLIVF